MNYCAVYLATIGCLIGTFLVPTILAAPTESDDLLCSTPLCNQIADDISASINETVNPCDDFYEYSCGGWKAKHSIPATSSRFNKMDILFERLEGLLKSSLEQSKTNNKTHAKCVEYSRDVFEMCLNSVNFTEHSSNKYVVDFAENYLLDVIGYERLLNDTVVPWYEMYVSSIFYYGLSPWFRMSIQPDPKNVTTNILSLDPVSFLLGDNELQNMDKNMPLIVAYKEYFEKMSMLLMEKNDTKLRDEANDLVMLDSSLAKQKLSPEKQRDPNVVYNKMTLKQLSEITKFDWLAKIVQPLIIGFKIQDYKLTNDTEVLVSDVHYIEQAIEILNKTNSITYYNYFLMQLLLDYGQYASGELRRFAFEFNKVQTGVEKEDELDKICMDLVYDDFPMVLSRTFADSYFPDSDKRAAEVIIHDIHLAYEQLVTDNKWLDNDTKAKSLDKLKKVHINIAYPEWMMKDDELDRFHGLNSDNFYKELKEQPNFVMGIAMYRANMVRLEFEQLFNQTDVDYRWPMPPAIVNAAYEPTQNSITIPAGFLALPFFHADQPSSMNYGAIGIVIGHELTHGLDDQGRQFDAKGNLHGWWSDEAVARFQNRSQCFVKQYGSKHIDAINMNVNGNLTLGENIADNGGVHEAFRAYQNAQAKSPSPRLAKLPKFTSDQLFFVSFAQTWCGLVRPEYLRRQIEYDPHSPMQFRTNVPFSNSPDFSNTFKCPAGSPMNPKEKCLLW